MSDNKKPEVIADICGLKIAVMTKAQAAKAQELLCPFCPGELIPQHIENINASVAVCSTCKKPYLLEPKRA